MLNWRNAKGFQDISVFVKWRFYHPNCSRPHDTFQNAHLNVGLIWNRKSMKALDMSITKAVVPTYYANYSVE